MKDGQLREYEVEVTWTYRVKVQAASKDDAVEIALETAIDRSVSGTAPDSEEAEVIETTDGDDD